MDENQLEWDLDEDLEGVESLLNTQSRIHDRTQFESKFDFELSSDQHQGKNHYEVDLYLFLPKAVGISSENYPREAFYGDMTHLLRVRTPELKRSHGHIFSTPRLDSVEQYFRHHLDTSQRARLAQLVIHDTRLFGCLVYTELKRVRSDLARLIKRSQNNKNPDLVIRFHQRFMTRVESVHVAIRQYRDRYIWPLKSRPLLVDDEVRRALLLVDEYLSYRLESSFIAICRLIEPYASSLEDLRHQLEALLVGELAYRNENVQAAAERVEARVETYYYRLGLLKKYVSEVLFLQTKRINKDYVYRNFIAALGAALAAAFAVLTNVQTTRMLVNGDDWGFRLIAITMLGILAYVFKDRIKDLTKEYFNNRLKSWLPDFDVQMFYTHFDAQGNVQKAYLGSSQETVRYLQRNALPPDIDYLRQLGHRAELEPERIEEILHYNKRMSFEVERSLLDHFGQAKVKRIHDVLRFDVSQFLAKMADPQQKLSYFHADKGIITTEAPRVYHLNMVFRYRVSCWKGVNQHEQISDYERLRLVLNKKGIVRVETVVARGELGQVETCQPRSGSSLPPVITGRPIRFLGGRVSL